MTTTYPLSATERPPLVASKLHTALVVLVFLVLALLGLRAPRALPAPAQGRPNVLAIYLPVVVMEWALVFFIWRGVRRTGTRLSDLVGGRWATAGDIARDVAIAALLWGVWTGLFTLWSAWRPDALPERVTALLPHGLVESVVWFALSCSAGFAEELVCRGYLLRQMRALWGSDAAAVVLQAAVFAVAHLYQGVTACLKIALFGLLFGIVALWRRSLRPGMLAHAWTDIASGLLHL